MALKGFPNVVTWGQHQYNVGEKPTATLYTDIIHHVGTLKLFFKHYEFTCAVYLD